MEQTGITVYGTAWCGDCRRAKLFLDTRKIGYDWVDIEQDAEAAIKVMDINGGYRSVPTIVFEDGSILVEAEQRRARPEVRRPLIVATNGDG